jgi:hypothetical protein
MEEAALTRLQHEIAALENLLAEKRRQLEAARMAVPKEDSSRPDSPAVNNHSPPEAKIALFGSLFKGRDDLYAKRFENRKNGKSGYQPVCRNEWLEGICEKTKKHRISCGSCSRRAFEPVTGEVIRNHLAGFAPAKNEWASPAPFVMGVYPLLQNETCCFLAIDFDKKTWQEDAKAFMETCRIEKIPAALERSRSGNGAHVWVFFEPPVPAAKARKLGSHLMTRTLNWRPEIGLDSVDRFFPKRNRPGETHLGNSAKDGNRNPRKFTSPETPSGKTGLCEFYNYPEEFREAIT